MSSRVDPTTFPPALQFVVWGVETSKDFVLELVTKMTELAKTKGGFLLCLGFFFLSLSLAGLTAFEVSRGADGSYKIRSHGVGMKQKLAEPAEAEPAEGEPSIDAEDLDSAGVSAP